jgi:flagellar basal body-associated protein FliL
MKKKLIIALPVLLLLVGGFMAKKILLKPKPAPPPKIAGELLTLAPEFLINLSDGHYGKLTVALTLEKAPAAAEGGEAPKLPQDAAIRADVTDALTGLNSNDLINRTKRHRLQKTLLRSINKTTDEPVKGVMFTDIAVQ